MKDWFSRIFMRTRPTFQERFRSLARVHGLEGKTDVQIIQLGQHTRLRLVPIIEEGESRGQELPEAFVEKARILGMLFFGNPEFVLGGALTVEEIYEFQDQWDFHAALHNSAR